MELRSDKQPTAASPAGGDGQTKAVFGKERNGRAKNVGIGRREGIRAPKKLKTTK
jgi:hypothetical protein